MAKSRKHAEAGCSSGPSTCSDGCTRIQVTEQKSLMTYRQVMRPMTRILAYKLLSSGRLAFWVHVTILGVQLLLTTLVWKGMWCSRKHGKDMAMIVFVVMAAIVVQNHISEFSFFWKRDSIYKMILQMDAACARLLDQTELERFHRVSVGIRRAFFAYSVTLTAITLANFMYPEWILYPIFGIEESESIECCFEVVDSLPCLGLRCIVHIISAWHVYYGPVYMLHTFVFVFNIFILKRVFQALSTKIRTTLNCRMSTSSSVDSIVLNLLQEHKTLTNLFRAKIECNQLAFTTYCASLLTVFVFIIRALNIFSDDPGVQRDYVFFVNLLGAFIFAQGFIVCVIMLGSLNEEATNSILNLIKSDHVSALGTSINKTSEMVDRQLLAYLENMALDPPLMKFFDKWVANRELVLTAGVMTTSFIFMVYGI